MRLNNSANIVFDSDLTEGRGRHFTSRFIEAGAVSYAQGVLKVSKEALDSFAQTLVGCPVIIRHQNITSENADDLRVGVVSSVRFDPNDGWFWCDGVIWDTEALKKIEQGWSVSCCYDAEQTTGEDGEWHNMHYDDELVTGRFIHLAIVPNPRYEDATILLNSKEEKSAMLFNLFNSKKIRNSENEGEKMVKKNEESIDKNALKDEIMEHINKAVKGEEKVDGQPEDSWYEELRAMLDKLAYTESESEKSNEKDEDKDEDKEENSCKSNESDEDKEDDKEEKKENEDEDEEKEDEKENRKSNSKEFDDMKRLSNSGESEIKSGYMSESARLALGKTLF